MAGFALVGGNSSVAQRKYDAYLKEKEERRRRELGGSVSSASSSATETGQKQAASISIPIQRQDSLPSESPKSSYSVPVVLQDDDSLSGSERDRRFSLSKWNFKRGRSKSRSSSHSSDRSSANVHPGVPDGRGKSPSRLNPNGASSPVDIAIRQPTRNSTANSFDCGVGSPLSSAPLQDHSRPSSVSQESIEGAPVSRKSTTSEPHSGAASPRSGRAFSPVRPASSSEPSTQNNLHSNIQGSGLHPRTASQSSGKQDIARKDSRHEISRKESKASIESIGAPASKSKPYRRQADPTAAWRTTVTPVRQASNASLNGYPTISRTNSLELALVSDDQENSDTGNELVPVRPSTITGNKLDDEDFIDDLYGIERDDVDTLVTIWKTYSRFTNKVTSNQMREIAEYLVLCKTGFPVKENHMRMARALNTVSLTKIDSLYRTAREKYDNGIIRVNRVIYGKAIANYFYRTFENMVDLEDDNSARDAKKVARRNIYSMDVATFRVDGTASTNTSISHSKEARPADPLIGAWWAIEWLSLESSSAADSNPRMQPMIHEEGVCLTDINDNLQKQPVSEIEIGFRWLKGYFEPASRARMENNDEARVLICSDDSPLLTGAFIAYCYTHNIALIAIPAQIAKLINPMSRVFDNMMSSLFRRGHSMDFNIPTIDAVMKVWVDKYDKSASFALTEYDIKMAWAETGLFPYNPDLPLQELVDELVGGVSVGEIPIEFKGVDDRWMNAMDLSKTFQGLRVG